MYICQLIIKREFGKTILKSFINNLADPKNTNKAVKSMVIPKTGMASKMKNIKSCHNMSTSVESENIKDIKLIKPDCDKSAQTALKAGKNAMAEPIIPIENNTNLLRKIIICRSRLIRLKISPKSSSDGSGALR